MFSNNIKSEEKLPLFVDERKREKNNYGTSSTQHKFNDLDSPESDSHSPYPKAVIFVLFSKMFEAFAANGVRSVLGFYLRDNLLFNEAYATSILHTFNFFSQFLPIVGACIADSYVGNTKTILYFSNIYFVGYLCIFLSTLPTLYMIHSIIYISLLMIAVGNGCLRACVASLGAHQFKLPLHSASLERYFSFYYFFYYFGILMAKLVPAFVRSHILVTSYCMLTGQCYTSVFGIILITFLASWVIFLFGIPYYKKETPTRESTMFKTLDCVYYAVSQKVKGKSSKSHWIDVAEEKYSKEFISDVKKFLKIVKVFLPLPIFYALLAQQDSTWTFQASLMDTKIFGIEIEADQFKAIGPVLLLLLIPLWQKIVEPFLSYFNVHFTSLECVFIGGISASLSFVYAGFLQHFIFTDLASRHSILWQFPQFLLIMIAEMFISVTGLRFAYTNAPSSMKSILTAVFFITNALGNLLIVLITQMHLFTYQSYEFFFYAFLMLIAAIVIKFMADEYQSDENVSHEESTIEAFIFVEEVQSTNLEENISDTR